MGIRLSGQPLRHRGSGDIVSDAVPFGSIQVPANGQPIILTADRQTAGGYPKIGVVITADFPVLGQLKPGNEIEFCHVTPEQSIREFHLLETAISSFKDF